MTNNGNKRSVKFLKQTVDLPLPSGLIATVRRPPLSAWMASGRIPESLFHAAIASWKTGTLSNEVDYKELFALGLEIAQACLVWPRVVDEANLESDDEIELGQIPFEDIMAILGWAMQGSKNTMVQTSSGPVSAEALSSFRDDSNLSGDGIGSGEVLPAAVSVGGD